ncbi:DUF456 domain-containing protein [Blastopirellula marina]|uniref:Uncharacterized protein n=1 Tax=Blastopirellula marina TaxID=124 RepID=A0A2S8GJ98_9BACT|nr:DUF456 domain-containing protein [Blastopirellula marina]PQO44527.1 hypothetical protein C5Y93_19155 [Blastopirellula marina]
MNQRSSVQLGFRLGRLVLASLVAIVCASAVQGQTSPKSSDTIEFRRVYVPENRTQEWPRFGYEYAPQMKLEEFERMVRQYDQSQGPNGQDLPARKIVYRAVLEGRTLRGTAEFELNDASADEAQFVSLAGSNLFYFDQHERLEETRSFWVGAAGKRTGIFLRGARPQVELDWSYQTSAPSLDETTAELKLAFAPQVDFYLTLPEKYDITLREGIQLEPPTLDESGEQPLRTWHLSPQWQSELSLTLVDRNREFKSGEAIVTQASQYRVRTNLCEVSTDIALQTPPPGPFDLSIPAELILSRVSVNGQELEKYDLQELSPSRRQLRIPHAMFAMGETAKVVVEGTAPLTIGNYSQIDLPLIFVASELTESHIVAVELDAGIHLSYCKLKNAEQVTFLPHNSRGRSNLQFRLFDDTAPIGGSRVGTARIDLQLYRPQPKPSLILVHKAIVNDLKIQSESMIRAAEGERLGDPLELPLSQGWLTESVVYLGSKTPPRWEETVRDSQRVLRIENTSESTTLKVTLRRMRENDFGNLRIADFRPFDLPPGINHQEWVSIKPDAGFDLPLRPEGLVARQSHQEVPTEIDAMFGPDWKIPAFEIQGRSDLRYLLPVTRKRASYDADIDIQTRLEQDSHQTTAAIRLQGTGLLPESLFVWSTQPWPEEVTWTTPDLETVHWSTVTVAATEDPNAYYIYELRPPAKSVFPLILRGQFPEQTNPFKALLLMTVGSTQSETGSLTLIAPPNCQIEANQVLLRKVYLDQPTDALADQVLRFEYRPLELRRLAELLDTLIECDWNQREALPPIFATKAEHQLRVENDGQYRMTSAWQVISRTDTLAAFQLPEEATTSLVEWQGAPWASWHERNGQLEVEIPEADTTAELRVHYTIDDGPIHLVRGVLPQFAEAEFPASTVDYHYSLADHLQRVVLPETRWSQFGKHLRNCLWGGIFQSSLLTSASLSDDTAVAVHRWSGGGIWIVHRRSLLVLSIGILMTALLIGVRLFPKVPRWLTAVLFAIAGVAVWLPDVFAPLSSAAFLGLILGGIVGFLLIPSNQTAADHINGSTIRNTRSTITASSLLLAVVLGLTADRVSTLNAADEPGKTKAANYPVLIPIDEDRKSIGQAYLPQPFYERLIASTPSTEAPLPRDIVEGIRYEIAPLDSIDPGAAIAVTTHIEIFTTQANIASQSVRIPFDPQLGETIETALHNDSILVNAFNSETSELIIPIKMAGPHSIKIQSSIPIESEVDAPLSLHLDTPANISTAVTLVDSIRMGSPVIKLANRKVTVEPSNIRQTIPLGPIAGFDLQWDSPGLQAEFEFQEYDLLELQEDEVQLRVRLKLTNRPMQMGPILLSVDSRMTLNMQQSLDWTAEVKSSSLSSTTRTYAINLLEGSMPIEEIDLRFTLQGAQQVGQLRFPNIRVLNGLLQRRWVAVSSPLQVGSRARSRVSVLSQEEFLRQWDEKIPDFRFAVVASTTEPLNLLIPSRPIATRGNADLRYELDLDSDGYDFEIKAQIETYSGQPRQYVVEMLPGCDVSAVQYLVDGLARPIQWHYDEASGELGVVLLSNVTGLQELDVRGRKWLAADEGDLILSPINIREVHTEHSRVMLTRDQSVLVRSLLSTNLIPIQEEPVEPSDLQKVPVGQWQVSDPTLPVGWQILPNQVDVRGDLLTIVNRVDGVWTMQWVGQLKVHSGSVGYLQWLVPPDITIDVDSIEDFEVTSWPLPDNSATVYQMKPLSPAALKFDWRGTLEPTPGKRTSFSPLLLVGQPYVSQYVALPRMVDKQEVLPPSPVFRKTVGANRWLTTNTPLTHNLLQATRPDYVCQILQRSNPTGQPQIDALETTLHIDERGDVFGVMQGTVLPQGNNRIKFRTPEGVEILGAAVDFQRQWQLDPSENDTSSLVLRSDTLPQIVEIAFRSKLTPGQTPETQNVPRPSFVPATNTQERLRLRLPSDWQVDDETQLDQKTWYQDKVMTAFEMKNASRETQSSIGSAEIQRWNKLRMEQAFSALKRYQAMLRAAGISPEETHRTITSLLGDNAAEVESWLISDQGDVLRAPHSLADTSENSHDRFVYLAGESPIDQLPIRATRVRHGSMWPLALCSLAALAAILLLFIKLPLVSAVSIAARNWASRNPQICGILLGLFWWLLLPPHFIGLLIIAAVVWASIPFRAGSLIGRA